MLDPITSLLAVCTNCNQPDAGSDQHPATFPIVVCDAKGRSPQAVQQSVSSTPCISPPEITASLPERVVGAARNQYQTHAASRPSSPESAVLVSWSNSTLNRTVASAAPNSTSGETSGASGKSRNQLLQLGSQGQPVSSLQSQLRQLGYYAGSIDGVYGQQTRSAVAQFQRANDLQADGVVGAATWTALQSAADPSNSRPSNSRPSNSRPPQAEKPPAPQANQANQANPETDRSTSQTPQSPPAVAAPAETSPAKTSTQSDQNSESSSQAGFKYLWILGWGIIYGCGWFFILKDTVKEIRGFHFVMVTNRKSTRRTEQGAIAQNAAQPEKDSKVATTTAKETVAQTAEKATDKITAQSARSSNSAIAPPTKSVPSALFDRSTSHSPVQSFVNAIAVAPQATSGQVDNQKSNSASDHAASDYADKFEHVALLDPWQEELDTAEITTTPEILQVTLADEGKVQPIQNVFVVAPRPTAYARRQTKKPTSIYGTKAMRHRIKTG